MSDQDLALVGIAIINFVGIGFAIYVIKFNINRRQ